MCMVTFVVSFFNGMILFFQRSHVILKLIKSDVFAVAFDLVVYPVILYAMVKSLYILLGSLLVIKAFNSCLPFSIVHILCQTFC